MTKPNLTDDDYSDLAGLVREAIDAERIRIGPRIKKLRGLLARLDPASIERTVTPSPAPRPRLRCQECDAKGTTVVSIRSVDYSLMRFVWISITFFLTLITPA